ncbi:MAG: hypothetical protein R2807_00650 [Chitinophagales bacterium]
MRAIGKEASVMINDAEKDSKRNLRKQQLQVSALLNFHFGKNMATMKRHSRLKKLGTVDAGAMRKSAGTLLQIILGYISISQIRLYNVAL